MTRTERFKYARERCGYSLRQVSIKTQLARSAIQTLEKREDVDPRWHTIETLAKAYNVDVVWLMKGEKNEKK